MQASLASRATLLLVCCAVGCAADATSQERVRRAELANGPVPLPSIDGWQDYVPGSWRWHEVEGAKCHGGVDRNTGIGLNLTTESNDWIIHLEAGGACYDCVSCLAMSENLDGFYEEKFTKWRDAEHCDGHRYSVEGVWNRTNPDNPFRRMNFVQLFHCTGDVYAGRNGRWFGFNNVWRSVRALLKIIKARTSEPPGRIVVAGSSAGSFGAMFNYEQIHRAFAEAYGERFEATQTYLIADSGITLPNRHLSTRLQQLWVRKWGFALLDAQGNWNPDAEKEQERLARAASTVEGPIGRFTLPEGCRNDTMCLDWSPDGGGLSTLLPYYATTYPTTRIAVILSDTDHVARLFLRSPAGTVLPMRIEEWRRGICALQQRVAAYENLAFYLVGVNADRCRGDYVNFRDRRIFRDHTWLTRDDHFEVGPRSVERHRLGNRSMPPLHSTAHVSLSRWLGFMVDRTEPWHDALPEDASRRCVVP